MNPFIKISHVHEIVNLKTKEQVVFKEISNKNLTGSRNVEKSEVGESLEVVDDSDSSDSSSTNGSQETLMKHY